MKLSELAGMLGSQVTGAGEDFEVMGISTLDEAGPWDVSFVTEKKFLKQAHETEAGAVLVPESLLLEGKPFIRLKDTWAGVLAALKHFHPGFARREYEGVHPTAVIDPSADLAAEVSVGPLAVIGSGAIVGTGTYIGPGVVVGNGCRIGERCTIYANAVLEAETALGNEVYVQPGAVIGSDGFKYELLRGRWAKIPQVGHVEIGDGAEIGANTCIDRASYTVTEVGQNTKIDNLVQIAHNVRVGENTVVVSQTGIAGSTTIGNNTILAAQVGVADNLKVGSQAVVMARSGVIQNVEDGEHVMGFPARAPMKTRRIMAAESRLPEMQAELKRLAKKVEELESRLKANEEK